MSSARRPSADGEVKGVGRGPAPWARPTQINHRQIDRTKRATWVLRRCAWHDMHLYGVISCFKMPRIVGCAGGNGDASGLYGGNGDASFAGAGGRA